MRTMVATNQRDYATISHMDMAGSHDKSSCRSATINNNIWTAGWRDGWCDSSSLNSVIRSRRVASRCVALQSAAPRRTMNARVISPVSALLWMRAASHDNKSIDERHRRRTGARIPRECAHRAVRRFDVHAERSISRARVALLATWNWLFSISFFYFPEWNILYELFVKFTNFYQYCLLDFIIKC